MQMPDNFFIRLDCGRMLRVVRAGDGCLIQPGHLSLFAVIDRDRCTAQERVINEVLLEIAENRYTDPANLMFVPPEDYDELVLGFAGIEAARVN